MEKKRKLYKCKLCDQPIKDAHLLAISKIKQTFGTANLGDEHSSNWMEPLDIGWSKEISNFYHVECFEEVAGREFVTEHTDADPTNNPTGNIDFIDRIKALAGITGDDET